MELKKEIVLNNWQEGMAQSCHLGFEEIRGLDPFTVPGEMTVNYKLANSSISSDSGVDAIPIQILNHISLATGSAFDFVLLSDGDVWAGSTLEEIKAASFTDLCPYKGYLMAANGNDLSAFDGTTWDDNVITDLTPGFMLSSLDDKLYVANVSPSANKIYTIEEKSGEIFDPNNDTTYTITSPALTLPADMVVVCMCDLGTYIAIAAYSKYDRTKGYVYLWDGEATAASNRVIINGGIVNAMVAKNNRLFCQVGNKCEWYVTDGSTAQLFSKMPESFMTYFGSFTVDKYGLDFNEKGNIIFGISQPNASNGMTPNGIFELNTDTGKISFNNTVSAGVGVTADPISIRAVRFNTFRSYRVGWAYYTSTPSYGVDDLSNSYRITSYGAYIVSPFYQLGSSVGDKSAKLKGFEIHLTKLLPTGCGLKMYYRNIQGGDWTQWGSTITDTTNNIFWQTAGLDSVKNIQFKLEVTTPSNNDVTPNILKVIIY